MGNFGLGSTYLRKVPLAATNAASARAFGSTLLQADRHRNGDMNNNDSIGIHDHDLTAPCPPLGRRITERQAHVHESPVPYRQCPRSTLDSIGARQESKRTASSIRVDKGETSGGGVRNTSVGWVDPRAPGPGPARLPGIPPSSTCRQSGSGLLLLRAPGHGTGSLDFAFTDRKPTRPRPDKGHFTTSTLLRRHHTLEAYWIPNFITMHSGDWVDRELPAIETNQADQPATGLGTRPACCYRCLETPPLFSFFLVLLLFRHFIVLYRNPSRGKKQRSRSPHQKKGNFLPCHPPAISLTASYYNALYTTHGSITLHHIMLK
ncbi:hypothetical protein B0H65DRAFT_296239 [Neurospora tetraspora]|uniref:Uncharacterized protein n=1 Tax=Neurospora tetraspora TaxID=94610 RepID=A0AAE0J9S0_9PEZI|nr:hypothetical protein B0H65DRAFT_296239 [Neurospora tetraspora]